MNIDDETLMAFADGELDAAGKATVESALRSDPELQRRVAAHRALRRRLQSAYAPELAEAVPERLLAAARGAAAQSPNRVFDLQEARDKSKRSSEALPRPPWWRPVGAMAASVIVGIAAGHFFWRGDQSPFARSADGAVVAHGQLASILSAQLTVDQRPGTAVRIGMSFRAKSGEYCRTFSLLGETSPAGVACRHGSDWQIHTLTEASGGAGMPGYRTAASAMAPAVLAAVENDIEGEPLDQSEEAAARDKGWKAAYR